MTKNNLTCFLLVLNLTSAKVSPDWGLNKNNDNSIDDASEYNNEWDTCAMDAFPAKPETMCCGVDITSNNRIVGGEPTALNQYPWMAIIEYQYINRKVRSMLCGGSLISGRYVLTAAHCVAGKVLEQNIPINVILGDYDKFHNGPDCIISNERKICTEGELRIPIQKVKIHPGYDNRTQNNDIALIQLTMIALYTEATRPICLPSGDLTQQFQDNLWLDIAGWGTMKEEIVGDIYKSNSSAVKRHLRVPFVPTQECQIIRPMVNAQQMCAGGLDGKGACIGDSGGPLMLNNRGQYEVVGVISYGRGKPCGHKGIPTVYTNVHEYNAWILNQIDIMERLDNNMEFMRLKPNYTLQTARTADIISKGNGLNILDETTTTQTQNSSTKENIEVTRRRPLQESTPIRSIKATITPSQQSTSNGNIEVTSTTSKQYSFSFFCCFLVKYVVYYLTETQ